MTATAVQLKGTDNNQNLDKLREKTLSQENSKPNPFQVMVSLKTAIHVFSALQVGSQKSSLHNKDRSILCKTNDNSWVCVDANKQWRSFGRGQKDNSGGNTEKQGEPV